jgi:general secretion pathway protein A
MYTQFFGLQHEPFSIAPDPRYLFMSERHREALAHLLYGVNGGGGFVLLSGEIGAGKTTVCRCFLEQIPRRCNVAYIFNPKLTVTELLKSVCDEFRIPYQHEGPGTPTVKDHLDPLNEYLLKTHAVGQNNVLIIDEAQNLSPEVLEQLRLLTNLETSERKLLQIILIGQPELREMLARPELEQLAQRVIARFHLQALSADETEQYIRHRLAVAGMKRALPFDGRALRRIHRLSRGVPRRINLLCDRALLGAYASGRPTVDRRMLDQAANEVFDETTQRRPLARPAMWGLGAVAGAALMGVVTLAMDTGARRAPGAVASPIKPVALAASAAASAVPATPPASAASMPAPVLIAAQELAESLKSAPRSPGQAWRELARGWKVDLADGDPCQAAQRQQLQCFKSSGSSLALIRQLGRPGIVTLNDEGRAVPALLTGLSAHSATLNLGDATRSVSLQTLAQLWRGDFATLWRAPVGYSGRIADGDAGPAAQWLAGQLARVQPAAADASLKARIHAFQLAQGLEADGVAGPMTFMQLNRASGVDEPRLTAER